MSDPSLRTLKRRRESSLDPPELVRHETLYFEDGDIVLTAPSVDGQRRLVFRVDKIFLARKSPVFKDMLTFSPGQDAEDIYEGVPRVDFTDIAEELAVLLGEMYDRSTLKLLLKRFDPDKPLRMRGVLRLAMKYDMEWIKDTIVKDIEDDWPESLEAYYAWRTERDRVGQLHKADFWKHVPEPASAMQFATDFGCTQISTATMYYLARTPPDGILPDPRAAGPLLPNRVRWHLLDAKNLFRVVKAQAIFNEYSSRFVTQFICQSKDCMTGDCHLKLESIAADGFRETRDIFRFCASASEWCSARSVCRKCISGNVPHICALQTRLWTAMQECAICEPVPWTQESL